MSVYTILQDIAQNILRRDIHINDIPWLSAGVEQEGQHPLTGQRAPPISGGN